MHYIFEAILVGFYSFLIYLFITQFTINIYLALFLTGMIKHLLGYLLIHTLYCKYGYACRNLSLQKASHSKYLPLEIIFEGFLYLFLGILFIPYFTNKTVFIIGFLLHIIAEKLYIHKYFCNNRCIL